MTAVGDDDHVAHVLDEDGVTETRFVCQGEQRYTNAEVITIRPGGVLDLGNGLTIKNGPPPDFTFTPGLFELP